MAAVLPCLCDGGVFGTFIDWRGYPTVHSAAVKLGLWTKTNAGMGSPYRSQHELLAPSVGNGQAGAASSDVTAAIDAVKADRKNLRPRG
jgi:hypothetical protein